MAEIQSKINKRRRLVIFFILIIVSGCTLEQPLSSESEDGKYLFEVHRNEKSLLNIVITNTITKEKIALQSGASNVHKWAIGWNADENIIVMASSDIGPTAWAESKSWEPIEVTVELTAF